MLTAIGYALRFLVVSTVVGVIVWVFAGAFTQSDLIAGLSIGVANTVVLFTTISLFVDAKLAEALDRADDSVETEGVAAFGEF